MSSKLLFQVAETQSASAQARLVLGDGLLFPLALYKLLGCNSHANILSIGVHSLVASAPSQSFVTINCLSISSADRVFVFPALQICGILGVTGMSARD